MENRDLIESDGATTQPLTPSAAWIAEYTKQATDALYAKATRYATTRADLVATTGREVDDDYVEDLVAEAYASTWCQTLSWDPTRCALEQHIIFAIKCRSRHDYDRGAARRRVSLDPHTPSGTLALAEAALAARTDEAGDDNTLAEEAMAELRSIAQDDLDVLRLLDAFDAGLFTRTEIRAKTKQSMKQYRNALVRLARYRKQLSAELLKRAQARSRGRKS